MFQKTSFKKLSFYWPPKAHKVFFLSFSGISFWSHFSFICPQRIISAPLNPVDLLTIYNSPSMNIFWGNCLVLSGSLSVYYCNSSRSHRTWHGEFAQHISVEWIMVEILESYFLPVAISRGSTSYSSSEFPATVGVIFYSNVTVMYLGFNSNQITLLLENLYLSTIACKVKSRLQKPPTNEFLILELLSCCYFSVLLL